jgi:hypothetical protein
MMLIGSRIPFSTMPTRSLDFETKKVEHNHSLGGGGHMGELPQDEYPGHVIIMCQTRNSSTQRCLCTLGKVAHAPGKPSVGSSRRYPLKACDVKRRY